MKEHLQVRPHLFQMRLPRQLHHAVQHGEHPRWHTADVGDIHAASLAGYPLTLHLKISKQGCLLLGHTDEIHQRIDVLDEDGTEVTHQRILHVIVGRMAATQYQTLAVKHPRLGVVAQVECHRVAPACIVNLLQTLAAHGNELRLVVRRAARLGIPPDASRPQHILLTMTHAVYLALQFLIAVHGIQLHEILIALRRGKAMFTTVFRILRTGYQMLQHSPLQLLAAGLMLLQFSHARGEYMSY